MIEAASREEASGRIIHDDCRGHLVHGPWRASGALESGEPGLKAGVSARVGLCVGSMRERDTRKVHRAWRGTRPGDCDKRRKRSSDGECRRKIALIVKLARGPILAPPAGAAPGP